MYQDVTLAHLIFLTTTWSRYSFDPYCLSEEINIEKVLVNNSQWQDLKPNLLVSDPKCYNARISAVTLTE